MDALCKHSTTNAQRVQTVQRTRTVWLQGQSGGPSRGGPRMQPSLYHSRSPGPSVSHMSSVSEAGWSQNRPQQQHRKKPAKGLDDGSAASLEVAAMFPLAQRLFVLFLEAADSHRLNTHLATCALALLAVRFYLNHFQFYFTRASTFL